MRIICFSLLLLLCLGGCTEEVSTLPTNDCATFIGDSITEIWPMKNFVRYDRGCYINHGKGGTTMVQILDGIDNHSLPYDASVDPANTTVAVVGGDIYNGLSQGYSLAQMEASYDLTIAKLRLLGVRIVLCTLLPSDNAKFNIQVVALNDWIRAKSSPGLAVADIYISPLVLPDGSSNPAQFLDRVHPTASAYAPLTSIVEAAIATAKLP